MTHVPSSAAAPGKGNVRAEPVARPPWQRPPGPRSRWFGLDLLRSMRPVRQAMVDNADHLLRWERWT